MDFIFMKKYRVFRRKLSKYDFGFRFDFKMELLLMFNGVIILNIFDYYRVIVYIYKIKVFLLE